jgi:DNA (cytosine-5)-methyltransferase 1
MSAYYNEIDPYVARWLRNLIATGLIPDGDVDERSIVDVRGADLVGYEQCHFFAGIAGWALALQLAGWQGSVWTGSCPCQPLSSAGRRAGHADQRHLWPAFQRLIAKRRPATVFGEQVASRDGREWLAGVRADLEHAGYACGAADLPAASVGAPHIRRRLFWVAYAQRDGAGSVTDRSATFGGVAHADATGSSIKRRARLSVNDVAPQRHYLNGRGETRRLGNATEQGSFPSTYAGILSEQESAAQECWRDGRGPPRSSTSFWADAEWISCLDGKTRRIEPGSFPLADGVPARLGRLRAYGNAIVPQVAAQFVRAFMECADG